MILNILFICKKVPYPATDGESIVIMNDLMTLKSLGHSVHIFAFNTKKHFVDTRNFSQNELWDSFEDVPIDTALSFKQILTPVFSKFPIQIHRFYSKKATQLLVDTITSANIDTIIYQGLATTIYHTRLAPSFKGTHIYRIHNVEHEIWGNLSKNATNYFHKWAYKIIAQSLKTYESQRLSSFDRMITLSENETLQFKTYYPLQNISSIAISLADDTFRSHYQESKEPSLLIVGSLDWKPNIEGIDWFLEHIYPHLSSVKLTIAGKGIAQDQWKKESISIISNFEHLESLFSTHSLLIIPLLSGAGIRIKVLEAMKYGMPFIATSKAVEGIQMNSLSYLVNNQKEEFILKIKKLLHSTELRIEYSKKLLANYSDNYSKESIANKWKNML